VYTWRRDLRKRLEAEVVILTSAEAEAPAFVPAVIEPGTMSEPVPAHHTRRRRRTRGAAVELEIDGVAVKIGHGADAGTIAAVIEALRATR
jgi:transposase